MYTGFVSINEEGAFHFKEEKMKAAINGLGRIGRAVFKILMEQDEVELVAVNDLVPPDNLAYLINHDTVYGRYKWPVNLEGEMLVSNGKKCRALSVKDPSALPWKDMGIDIVFECTGIFTKMEDLKKHIDAGAKKVILSAPAKSQEIRTVVHGVNKGGDEHIISCASCTTNCITPVVEIIGRRIGFKKALLNTIHAYTSSQSIVDAPAKKRRRGRAGAANLVPTSTGAAIATTKALPQYDGKFDGVAIRTPIPVGSIADLVFVLERRSGVDEVNAIFREEAKTDRYRNILGVSDEEIVSSDIIMDPRASIVDLTMTQAVDGDLLRVMSWYDNEWGYANQMVREALSSV